MSTAAEFVQTVLTDSMAESLSDLLKTFGRVPPEVAIDVVLNAWKEQTAAAKVGFLLSTTEANFSPSTDEADAFTRFKFPTR